MKPLSFNLKDAKKISGDKHSSTFALKSGHRITVAHAPLPHLQRKQLEKLPIHMDEGGVTSSDESASPSVTDVDQYINENQSQAVDPELANNWSGAKLIKDTFAPAANTPGTIGYDPSLPGPAPAYISLGNGKSSPSAPASIPESPSAAAVSIPEKPSSSSGGGIDINSAYRQGQQGIGEEAQAVQQNAQANAQNYQSDIESRKQLNDSFNKNLGEIQNHQKQVVADYAAGHIDPKHYVENMSVPQKVATAIGLFLGGLGGGLDKTGVNPAQEWLNAQINRDIESQKSNLDQKKTLLGANQELYKDAILGEQATRINMNDILDHQVQMQAAKSGSALAKARADQLHSKFAMENAELVNSMGIKKTLLDQMKSAGSGPIAIDPASVVPYFVKNSEQQNKVYEEIGRAQNVSINSQKILKAFDDAVKENTVLRTGAGLLRTPGSAMAFHQLLLPNFKQIDGTVRQAAMDETFHNLTPTSGDFQHKTDQKREALVNWMHSETAAPIAKGAGIDLSRFKSTAAPLSAAPKPAQVVQSGHVYNLNPQTGKYE